MHRTFVGDLHGDWRVLNQLLKHYKKSKIIQIGDLGLGFATYTNVATGEPFFEGDPESLPKNFRFIRGNHDSPEVCRQHPNYIGEYGFDQETNAFYISGAWSFDHAYRTVGLDWWEDEELSYQQLQKAIEDYEKIKPNVVFAHTCPATIAKTFLMNYKYEYHADRTENALDTMWKIHQPRLWVFGHWHRNFDQNVLKTRFLCLNINQAKVLDI